MGALASCTWFTMSHQDLLLIFLPGDARRMGNKARAWIRWSSGVIQTEIVAGRQAGRQALAFPSLFESRERYLHTYGSDWSI